MLSSSTVQLLCAHTHTCVAEAHDSLCAGCVLSFRRFTYVCCEKTVNLVSAQYLCRVLFRKFNCCCEHTRVCCRKQETLATAAVRTHMCVAESRDPWLSPACAWKDLGCYVCRRFCCWLQNRHVCCRSRKLAIAAVRAHMCVAKHTCVCDAESRWPWLSQVFSSR